MAVPPTTDEFLVYVTASGLVETARLDPYLQELRRKSSLPPTSHGFATRMVEDGMLTPFQAQQLLLGRYRNFIFGRYKILGLLGAGGMGRVYLCEHLVMRHRVAVKMLPRGKHEDPSRVARFLREARAVAALSHPNIVRAHDIDISNENHHYIVMDYVDGVSLHELVQKRGPLDPSHAAHYVGQVAAGLQHIDEAGLIHRDVKPANLILDRAGVIKILDLGLARFSNDKDRITDKYNDNTLLGTVDFMSPEQTVGGGEIDIRSDIYGLGASFYYLLTGRVLFETESVSQKILCQQRSEPTPVRSLRRDVPRKLAAILEKMLAKKPTSRFQSPSELAEALAPWADTLVPPPLNDELPYVSRPSKRSRTTHDTLKPRLTCPPTPALPAATQSPAVTASPPVAPTSDEVVGGSAPRRWWQLLPRPRSQQSMA